MVLPGIRGDGIEDQSTIPRLTYRRWLFVWGQDAVVLYNTRRSPRCPRISDYVIRTLFQA